MAVKLDGIVPWGRSFDEYRRMFALSDADLERSILDCAAGPSNFTAEMHRLGRRVIAVDPIYAMGPDEIRERIDSVRDCMMQQVRRQPEQFIWEDIESPEHLERVRISAMELFLADFASDRRRERYAVRSLPDLGFAARTFDLALCSHLLFLYSSELDAAFHIAAIAELLRVAEEVRIFPVTDMAGKRSAHLDAMLGEFPAKVVRVQYEFLRGANEMIVVAHREGEAPAEP